MNWTRPWSGHHKTVYFKNSVINAPFKVMQYPEVPVSYCEQNGYEVSRLKARCWHKVLRPRLGSLHQGFKTKTETLATWTGVHSSLDCGTAAFYVWLNEIHQQSLWWWPVTTSAVNFCFYLVVSRLGFILVLAMFPKEYVKFDLDVHDAALKKSYFVVPYNYKKLSSHD